MKGLPVEGAVAGDEVVVFAAGDVFDVTVPDAVFEKQEGGGDVFAEDDGVADVEVGAQQWRAEGVDQFTKLGGPFDEEHGFAFDADFDVELVGEFEEGFEGVFELLHGAVGGHGGEGFAAGDGDVVSADGLGEAEGVGNHADAVGAELRVRRDEGGFEEGFGRGILPVAEGAVGVDVGDGEMEAGEGGAEGVCFGGVEVVGVPVGFVGEDFDGRIAGGGDGFEGVWEWVAGEGVGGEGELHGG